MPNRSFRTFLGALTFAAFMICGGPAQAVFYGSDFDPVGPVTFSGHGLFQFDDACLASNGLHSAASCHLMLVSATIHMHDSLNSADLAFGPDVLHMIDLIIFGGNLVGVDTGLIGPSFVTDDASSLFGPWWLQWQSGFSPLLADTDPVNLFTGSCSEGCSPNGSPAAVALHVTFTRVGQAAPEPGTLGLLLGGLGAGWWVRRRRKAS
jgi:hypothetical protein